MPEAADVIYKSADDIVADITAAWQARLPGINLGPDSIARIWAIVFANSGEGLYLGQQLLHDDMFIQTANALALARYGEMYGRPQKTGTPSTGTLRFSGAGGTSIAVGTVVSAPSTDPDADDLTFATTGFGTIPNPGIPTAPTAADGGAGGLAAATYEYAVTFITVGGETEIGAASNALPQAVNRKVTLTAIPLGGAGTTARSLYERVNGGAWQKVTDAATVAALNNNTTVTVTVDTGTRGGAPPADSTAERIILAAQSQDVGIEFNVGIGAINSIQSTISGLADVMNTVSFTGATDTEDIETFRTELLKRVRAPQSGSTSDLESWATDVDGVESATAFKNVDLTGAAALGTVSLRISGPGGTIPSAGTVAAVQAALDAKDLANITILVGTFVAHPITVTVTMTLEPGYVLADVTPAITTAITGYINSVPVGAVVHVAGIVDAVFGLAGVQTLTVNLPAADVAMAANEKSTAGVITVN